jgi:hypothetical protein
MIRGFQGDPGAGIHVAPTTAAQVIVSDCTISGNASGVLVKPNSGVTAQVLLDRVLLMGNNTGIRADGGAIVRISQSVVTGNKVGLETVAAGQIMSLGNNAISGNATNENPSETMQPK